MISTPTNRISNKIRNPYFQRKAENKHLLYEKSTHEEVLFLLPMAGVEPAREFLPTGF